MPSVTSEILTTRYQLHRELVAKTESFLWLLDVQYSVPSDTVRPLDLPESSTLQLNSSGNLIVSRSSVSQLASIECLLYYGTRKDWLVPLAQFSIVNPEKCRRLVCTNNCLFVLILLIVCVHWFVYYQGTVLC